MIKNIIKPMKLLSKEEMSLMNKIRVREYGKEARKNFTKDYLPGTKFFLVKERGKILSFGGLEPISINYLNKNYNILGICNIFSVEKGRGYGNILVKEIIKYLKKREKTGLGFTGETEFFKKAGLKTKKDFIRRFVYLNPKTKEKIIDLDGDGIYYEGKDKFINKVISTEQKVNIPIIHW